MRATRFLLATLAVSLLASCASDPTTVIQADQRASFDGSGTSIASDTTTVPQRGVGFVGSGN